MSIFDDKTALIIEDDEMSIRVMQQLLKQINIPANVIWDSSKVKDQLTETPAPDVIFLDLEMPSSNGYTVLQMIQKDSKFDGVPVVAYTTHISHLNDARNAGFHSFLGKPVNGREFPTHLEKILNGENVWEVPM